MADEDPKFLGHTSSAASGEPAAEMGTCSSSLLADPILRSHLARVLSRRVNPNDVEDLVQTTLTEAFTAKDCPQTKEEVQRFVFAIARQRAIDLYRRRERERRRHSGLPELEPTQPLGPTGDLLRWAEDELPPAAEAKQTFDWMLRESEGETLADIAMKESVPAPVVRQRVSRLRRYFRQRWTKEIAALAALTMFALAVGLITHRTRTATSPTLATTASAINADPSESPAPLASTSPSSSPLPGVAVLDEPPPSATVVASTSAHRVVAPPVATPTPPHDKALSINDGLENANGKTPNAPKNANANGAAPFDRGAAASSLGSVNVQSCKTADGPTGAGHVTITFDPSGRVLSAVLDSGPYTVPSTTSQCIAGKYRAVSIPPFAGAPVRVGKSFTIN